MVKRVRYDEGTKGLNSFSLLPGSGGQAPSELLEIEQINRLFTIGSAASVATFVVMVVAVYASTPREEWVYLEPGEQHAAMIAGVSLALATLLLLMPFVVEKRFERMSAVVWAAVVVQSVAVITNLLLAMAPTVVIVDPVTHVRVFLHRWCEWVPLAGLMTFFSEAVEIPKSKRGVQAAVVASLSQSFSCLFGMLLPFATSVAMWNILLVASFANFLVIFPRLSGKRRGFLTTPRGSSFVEQERHDRLRFAYHLLYACTVVWTFLVVAYFANVLVHRCFPIGHYLRDTSAAMIIDTMFDVIAKALYMKLILEVHFAVFDAEGRAQRQLNELRSLMNVLWDTSSDVIVISVRNQDRITSMLSPSFPRMIGESLPPSIANRSATALLLQTAHYAQPNPQAETIEDVLSAVYIDSSELPYGGMFRHALLAEVDTNSPKATKALGIVTAAWNLATNDDTASLLTMHPMETSSGEECNCEIKVSLHAENAMVAVVRDVTERYRRFEAERRAHSETLARQKDAQSSTRFVRHEVKNGLLAGIELCDSLRNCIDELERVLVEQYKRDEAEVNADGSPVDVSRRRIEELDETLHDVLETVLAEAMARDVIHEVYHPRQERLDVAGLLASAGSKAGKSSRFPIQLADPDLPYLLLDPQLLRYIHRNAVSNGCKYGKEGGKVSTILSFDYESRRFIMKVVNEPGDGHEAMIALGEKAANEGVFAQGSTLHQNLSVADRYISSGDGAWIMQKCAKTMGGSCHIQFKPKGTVFTFSCPAEPLTVVEWPETHDFEVPAGTWGIALDDSKIQRKLMDRILAHAGVEESRRIVLGQSPSEVNELKTVLFDVLAEHPESKVLVLVDENLDFGTSDEEHVILSGSLVMKEILDATSDEQEKRIFSLVRSANDSAEDVSLYLSRTHGFFPKSPMQRERVREILAPLWAERFLLPSRGASLAHSTSSVRTGDDSVCTDDLLMSLEAVDTLLEDENWQWKKVWGALHALKGDLMVVESSPDLGAALGKISDMRGPAPPPNFDRLWPETRELILNVIRSYE